MISDCIIRTMLNNCMDSIQVLKHMEMHTNCVLTTVHSSYTPCSLTSGQCTLTSSQPSALSPQAAQCTLTSGQPSAHSPQVNPVHSHLRSAQCTLTSGQPSALSPQVSPLHPHLRHPMHPHLRSTQCTLPSGQSQCTLTPCTLTSVSGYRISYSLICG